VGNAQTCNPGGPDLICHIAKGGAQGHPPILGALLVPLWIGRQEFMAHAGFCDGFSFTIPGDSFTGCRTAIYANDQIFLGAHGKNPLSIKQGWPG